MYPFMEAAAKERLSSCQNVQSRAVAAAYLAHCGEFYPVIYVQPHQLAGSHTRSNSLSFGLGLDTPATISVQYVIPERHFDSWIESTSQK